MATKVRQIVKITRTTRRIGGSSKLAETKKLSNVDFEQKHPRGPDGRFVKKT